MTTTILEPTEQATVDLTPVAHMICPACYPTTPDVGEEVTRWCGLKLLLTPKPVTQESARCVICSNSSKCATCGATKTPFGLVKVPNQ